MVRTPWGTVNSMRPSRHSTVTSPDTSCGGMALPAWSTSRMTSRSRPLTRAWLGVFLRAGPKGRVETKSPEVACVMAMAALLCGVAGEPCGACSADARQRVTHQQVQHTTTAEGGAHLHEMMGVFGDGANTAGLAAQRRSEEHTS